MLNAGQYFWSVAETLRSKSTRRLEAPCALQLLWCTEFVSNAKKLALGHHWTMESGNFKSQHVKCKESVKLHRIQQFSKAKAWKLVETMPGAASDIDFSLLASTQVKSSHRLKISLQAWNATMQVCCQAASHSHHAANTLALYSDCLNGNCMALPIFSACACQTDVQSNGIHINLQLSNCERPLYDLKCNHGLKVNSLWSKLFGMGQPWDAMCLHPISTSWYANYQV